MAYAVQADIEARYNADFLVAIAPDEEGGVNDQAVLSALRDASEIIDTYAAARYETPVTFADAVAVLKVFCVDIAVQQYLQKGYDEEERAEARYDAAIEWLVRLSSGRVTLPEAALPEQKTGVTIQFKFAKRLFGGDKY